MNIGGDMNNILITGANRGIGLEFCKQYLNQENYLYVCCRHPDSAEELKSLQKQYPNNLSILKLDVSSETDIHELKNLLANKPIDILINNAGILTKKESGIELDAKSWHTILETNTIAPYLIINTLLENLRLGKQKKIINMSSILGSIALTEDGEYVAYNASKAALNSITKSLSKTHLKDHFTVVCLHPGWVRTDMGGPNAQIDVQKSVSGMIKLISGLSINDSGKFYGYDGKELPW
jgi:NAD(P)-dependent dehydrogenase (short-subunit alcohol dehydrogenase family)